MAVGELGTTDALRQVSEDTLRGEGDRNGGDGAWAVIRLRLWSADWTPWHALKEIDSRWPTLRFDVRPNYDP